MLGGLAGRGTALPPQACAAGCDPAKVRRPERRHIDNRPTSVGFDFDYEAPLLAPLPFEEFDFGLTPTPKVDKTSRITVRQNKHSGPARFTGTNVRVPLGPPACCARRPRPRPPASGARTARRKHRRVIRGRRQTGEHGCTFNPACPGQVRRNQRQQQLSERPQAKARGRTHHDYRGAGLPYLWYDPRQNQGRLTRTGGADNSGPLAVGDRLTSAAHSLLRPRNIVTSASPQRNQSPKRAHIRHNRCRFSRRALSRSRPVSHRLHALQPTEQPTWDHCWLSATRHAGHSAVPSPDGPMESRGGHVRMRRRATVPDTPGSCSPSARSPPATACGLLAIPPGFQAWNRQPGCGPRACTPPVTAPRCVRAMFHARPVIWSAARGCPVTAGQR